MQEQQQGHDDRQPALRLQSPSSTPSPSFPTSQLTHGATQSNYKPQPCKAADWDCPGDCHCLEKQMQPATEPATQTGTPASTDAGSKHTSTASTADMTTESSATSSSPDEGRNTYSSSSSPSQMAVDMQTGTQHTECGANGGVADDGSGDIGSKPALAPQAAVVRESQVRSHPSLCYTATASTYAASCSQSKLQSIFQFIN